MKSSGEMNAPIAAAVNPAFAETVVETIYRT